MGVKKSSVPTTARSSRSLYTHASSLDLPRPASTFGSTRGAAAARTWSSTRSSSWGRNLQAQPIPCVYRVSFTSSPPFTRRHGAGDAPLAGISRAAAPAIISAALSTSASVVPLPTLKRQVPIAQSTGTPMASSTCDTCTSSLWQAAPAEAATSSPISERSVLASTWWKDTFRVLGRRASTGPFSRMRPARSPRRSRSCSWRRSRSLVSWGRTLSRSRLATSQAFPSATECTTFSVLARRPASWAAPWSSRGRSGTVDRLYRAPMPFGAYSLCPATVKRSTPSSSTETGSFPRLCDASQCTKTLCGALRTRAVISLIGSSVPVSLLECMMLTQTVRAVMACSTASGLTSPCPSTGR
mmetsp:Transcript_75251/g.213067  ORF Transcript_75251/g.213067 Transcript_75251/m.213067 type:complete len:356 (-) Transcript_75251:18-1085(-)